MNDEKSGMTGTNLVSVAFYVVIISLLMSSMQTGSLAINDQFLPFFRRIWVVLTTQSVFCLFTISFYTKIVYDDLHGGRNDDRRNIGFLLVAWLLFVTQITLRSCCSIAATAFVFGLCFLTISGLISYLRGIPGQTSCRHRCHCLELMFNVIYMICGLVFIVQKCLCVIQAACGILVLEVILEMIIRKFGKGKEDEEVI